MKRFIALSASMMLVGVTGLAMAQSKTPVAVPAPKTISGTPSPGTPLHALNERLRADMMQIQKDLKAGKLTKAQADSLKAQVKAIRKQELADFKANGNGSTGSPQGRQLTADQISALNQELDQLQPSL